MSAGRFSAYGSGLRTLLLLLTDMQNKADTVMFDKLYCTAADQTAPCLPRGPASPVSLVPRQCVLVFRRLPYLDIHHPPVCSVDTCFLRW